MPVLSEIPVIVSTSLFLMLTLPFISFVISLTISEKYSWVVAFIATLLLFLSTISAIIVFIKIWYEPSIAVEWEWFDSGSRPFTAGILLNNLSVLMLLLVTLISFLIHVYSTGYMAGDADIRRYFAMLGFFTFAMLGIVVSGNLLLIFVFWELVGFSSYMLIGHWNEKPEATDAAKRAFLFNRVGDAGFLVGLMVIWTLHGTFNITELDTAAPPSFWHSVAGLGIFCGVVGKSAQFPLFSWLPKAMEGPTPVSALIHAATMVAAGVYLLSRIFFMFTPLVLNVILITGTITALAGALAALVQHDMKRVLAYSTMSQLGLMVMAVGAGSPAAAILHLTTHAFFKACLFLAAGSVIHSLHQAQHQSHIAFDVQDIRNLGGLRHRLPFNFGSFVISGCSLAGIPFFSGFLSKEAIFDSLLVTEFNWRGLILLSALIVSFITVLYTFRMIWGIFMGEEKATKQLSIVESPPVMRAPIIVLAVASIWIFVAWNPFDYSGWIFNGLYKGKYFHLTLLAPISTIWVVVALGIAYKTKKRSFASPLLFHVFYIENLIKRIIEKPVLQLSGITTYLDKKWIDGTLHTAAYIHVIVAHTIGWIDRVFIDGTVNGIARMAKGAGSLTRSFQGGKIQLYIFWAAFAIIIFIIWNLL